MSMPYYLYRIGALGVLEKLGEHARFPDASKAAKALRQTGEPAGTSIKVIHAENELQAEDLISTQRPFERTGEDD
jgi:hypothetical protein